MSVSTDHFDPDDFTDAKQKELDKTLLVKFLYRPFQDAEATLKEGRPIFKERVYIDIRIPGQRDNICRPATERDIQRFQAHYDAFMKRTDDSQLVGLPLTEWPLVSRSQVEELAYFNVKTVEQLAGMPDSGAQNLRGVMGLKQKAREWLESNKSKEEIKQAFAEREEELKSERDTLQAQLDELKQQVAQLSAKKTTKKVAKKRGRPPKAKVDASTADTDGE